VGGDRERHGPAGGDEVLWTADGNGLIAVTAKRRKGQPDTGGYRVGKMTDITTGNQAVEPLPRAR